MSDLTPEREAELRAAVKLKDSQPGKLCMECSETALVPRDHGTSYNRATYFYASEIHHPANRPHGIFPRTSE